MKPYPKYKDSGVEWLGEIPEGWAIDKFSRIAYFQEGPGLRNWQFSDSGIRVVCVTNITEKGINFSKLQKFISLKEYQEKYQHFTVQKGDLLLASSGASWGKLAVYNHNEISILNTSTIRLNTGDNVSISIGFIRWNLRAKYISEQLESLLTGSCQPNFGPTHLSQLLSVLPPLAEQKAIATFLDRETQKIDTLIAKQEQLIALLEEKRQALISHAVTKGLDPNAKMKDSGVEWLGEIPEHWVVDRLKYISKINPSKAEINSFPKNLKVTFLPMEMVSEDGKINTEKDKSLEEVYQGFTYFRNSDVLVAKITPCFENGKGGVCEGLLNGIGFGSTEFHVLRPTTKSERFFIFYITRLYHFRNFGESEMRGSAGQKRVTADYLQDYKLGVPPLTEQKEITDYLDKQTEKLDLLKEKSLSVIELLKEKRSALISSAVTGKIDIRDLV
jgi:type I restriction enzyme, S subunit